MGRCRTISHPPHDAHHVSEIFDPRRGSRSRASSSPTSPTTAPSMRRSCASRSTGPRSATRSGRTPSTSCTPRSITPGMSTDVGCVLLTGNGPSPKDGGWAFCSGGDQRIRGKDGYKYAEGTDADVDRAGPRRPAAHPRGAAADPLHAEGGDLRRARLGGGRRPLAPRRVRPHARQHRTRPLQADRRRRRQLRRRVRLGVPRPPGRPEVRPRDLLPRPRVHRRRRLPDGHGQRVGAPRRARGDRACSGAARSARRARRRSGC